MQIILRISKRLYLGILCVKSTRFLFIMTLEQVPEKFLKAVVGVHGLFEVRVEEGGNIYRIFCCMDEGNLVILFNGFQKKTQKTPLREIERAKRIMNEYFASKDRKGE